MAVGKMKKKNVFEKQIMGNNRVYLFIYTDSVPDPCDILGQKRITGSVQWITDPAVFVSGF
jgi:hypothetical protein